MWALALWIDVHDAQFCRISAHDEAARRGVVPSYAQARGSDPVVATEGLSDGINMVLFGEGKGARAELIGYGEADALAGRLQSHIAAWREHGSPTHRQLCVSAFSGERQVKDAAMLLRSPDSTTIIRYGKACEVSE